MLLSLMLLSMLMYYLVHIFNYTRTVAIFFTKKGYIYTLLFLMNYLVCVIIFNILLVNVNHYF